MPTWTAPRTWATDELVTAALLNTHLRDNLDALKSPPSASYLSTADVQTLTSNSWANLDANFALTITPSGTQVMAGINLIAKQTAANNGIFYVDIQSDDGTTQTAFAGSDGFAQAHCDNATPTQIKTLSGVVLISGLTAATQYTFRVRYKVATADDFDVLTGSSFWVREVS